MTPLRPITFRVPLASGLAVLASAGVAGAGPTLVVPVSADESVNSGFPDKNYADNTNRGGLFVGSDGTGTGVTRFYLKFMLPEFLDPSEVETARLSGVYTDDLDRNDNGVHRIHFVAADDWTEDKLNWDNQPGPTFGTPEASFDSASAVLGSRVTFDLTGTVVRELKGDRMLSLVFLASNEGIGRDNRNWEYFSEREFDPSRAFSLSIGTSGRVGGGGGGGAVPVPLPAAAWPAILTLGGAGGVAWWKRRRKTRAN